MRTIGSVARSVGALAIGVIVAAGCSNADGASDSGTYSVSDAVDQIPASIVEDGVIISTGDLVAASEIAGIERPEDLDDVASWAMAISGLQGSVEVDVPVFVPVEEMSSAGLRFGDLSGFEEELGWSILDLDSFVEVAVPPTRFAVLRGDFGDDPLSRLDELDNGVFTYGSGEDLVQDIENRNPVDRFGRPVRFGYEDGRLAMSTVTPAVEEWLDGDSGGGLDDLAAMAAVLDDHAVYSAVMAAGTDWFKIDHASPVTAEVIDDVWLPTEPFHAVAVGWSADDGDGVVTMVYAHDDADAASDNVDRFETMFSDGMSMAAQRPLDTTFDLIDVTAHDNLVVVRAAVVDDSPASVAYTALMQRDTPFLHE